jgi:hypothetical protein
MEEKYYLYKGKLFSYGTIKEKYGDSTDTKISELGMEDAYEYNGKVFGSSTLKEKYGDDYKNAISEKGITEYGVKKKGQTQPQKEDSTNVSQTVAEPLQESGGETNYLVNETAVTRDDLERNLSNDEFIQKVRSGEFNIQVSNDPALEKELENKIKPPSDKAIDKTIQNISGNDESTVKILGRSFQSGLADLSADIYRTPEFIYDVAVNGYNKLLELQDMILPESMESRKIATSEELSEMTGIDNKYAENLEAYAEKKNEINEKYRKPIFESIKQGNISDAALNTAMSVTESLPFMLSMMIPSAAGVKAGKMFLGTTAVMGAGRKQELSEEEGISETQKNANALLYGMAEATDVLMGSGAAGRAIGDVFNKSGKKSAVEFAEYVVEKMVKEKPYLSIFADSFQEAFTTYVQNLSDRATGVDKNKDLTEGVIDAFIVGATMGGMTGGVVQASKITSKLLNNKQDINDINELTKSPQVINEVTGQIDILINTGDLTEKKGSEIKEKIIKDVTVNASIPDKIQGDDRVKAIELQKKYIEVKANQEQASDAFKPLYKGELNELEVQLQELALKAKADANSKESQATPLQKGKRTTVEQYGDKKKVDSKRTEEDVDRDRKKELSILDAKQAESEKTGEIPTDENGNAIRIKEEKQKINSKYDAELAELAALESNQEVALKKDLEAQKADIQKRRQKELIEAPNEMLIAPMISDGKGGFIENPDITEAKEINKEINAKYDAELAALESNNVDNQSQVEDVNRRRQEELENRAKDIPVKYEQFKDINGNDITKVTYKDGSSDAFFTESGQEASKDGNLEGLIETNQKPYKTESAKERGKGKLENKINAEYDAEYVDAVKKGEMTKEQAMQALEEVGRKDSDAYLELKALEEQPTSTQSEIELKNEGKAEAPTKENVTERLNINNPFYKKVEDALVKLGLIEKYNPETGTGDVVGGFVQQTSDGGFSVRKMLFSQDGSISYFDGDVKVSFDKNGNVISENTKEAKQKAISLEIEGKKESIANLEKIRDSEAFKYKEVTETDVLGNKKKVKKLKTPQELKESTDKINAAINKSKAELKALEQQSTTGKKEVILDDKEVDFSPEIIEDNKNITEDLEAINKSVPADKETTKRISSLQEKINSKDRTGFLSELEKIAKNNKKAIIHIINDGTEQSKTLVENNDNIEYATTATSELSKNLLQYGEFGATIENVKSSDGNKIQYSISEGIMGDVDPVINRGRYRGSGDMDNQHNYLENVLGGNDMVIMSNNNIHARTKKEEGIISRVKNLIGSKKPQAEAGKNVPKNLPDKVKKLERIAKSKNPFNGTFIKAVIKPEKISKKDEEALLRLGAKDIKDIKTPTSESGNIYETSFLVKLFKGIDGKRDIKGNRINAHKGANGLFMSLEKDSANEYSKDGNIYDLTLPEGTTLEVIEVDQTGLTPKEYRDKEVKAINESKADVVKLITTDGKIKSGTKKQEQYVIKDGELINEFKKQLPSKQKESSGAKKPQEKQETATTATAEQKSKQQESEGKEDAIISKGVTVEGAPEGTYIDVEMIAGKDGRKLTPEEVLDAIPIDGIEFDNDGNNLMIKLPRELTSSEMMSLMKATEQEAIGQLSNGTGKLYAQSKKLLEDYGNEFNEKFFKTPRKEKLKKYEKSTAGNRIFNKPLEAVKEIANNYYERVFGKKRPIFKGITKIDKELAKRIANAYEAMQNNPNDPEVRAAYKALARETMEQHKEFDKAGFIIEINNKEPYNNAQEMIDDLRENRRIKIFSTESGFGDTPITDKQRKENPLLRDSGKKDANGKPLLINDIFRAIHDFYGHAELGNGFGAIGEENAWNVHARMYSPLARRAMTTETRGQNSWVNFSGINDEAFKKIDRARELRRQGKKAEAQEIVSQIYEMMSFAEQKVGLLPREFSELSLEEGTATAEQESKKEQEEAVKKAKEAFNLKPDNNKKSFIEKSKKLWDNIFTRLLDRQNIIKGILKGGGLINTYNRLVTSKGASGKAKAFFQEAEKKIYGGLSYEENKKLDEIIFLRRISAIDKNREKRGLPLDVKHPNGLTGAEADIALEQIKKENPEQFKKINDRADKYFNEFRSQLKKSLDAGLITQEMYDNLVEVDYQPRQFLKFIIGDEGVDVRSLVKLANDYGLSKPVIKALKDGDNTALNTDSKHILSSAINSAEKRLFQNEVGKTLARELPKSAERLKELQSKKNPTKKEIQELEDLKKVAESFKENPIVGYDKNGKPKYKYNSENSPKGYSTIHYYVDGVQNRILVKDNVYDQWVDNKRLFQNENARKIISIISGSALLKAMATGINPLFVVTNIPRDFGHILMHTNAFSSILPLGGYQLVKGTAKAWKEMRKGMNSDLFRDFVQYGGMMDFLHTQGGINEGNVLNDLISLRKHPELKRTLSNIANGLTVANKYSEIGFRLALFDKVINDGMKKINSEKLSKEEKSQAIEDLKYEAAARAREIIDFNQGGSWIKDAEAFLPYINAAVQGTRVAVEYAKENPAEYASKVTQAAITFSAITAGTSMLLIAALRGDDDDRKAGDIWVDTMERVSEYEKRTNVIIPTGIKDDKGNYTYIRISKTQQARPIFVVGDFFVENMARELSGKKPLSYDLLTDRLTESIFNDYLPIDPSAPHSLMTRNPLMGGLIETWTGYSFFRDEKISYDIDKVPLSMEGYKSEDMPEFYNELSDKFGLSPARTKNLTEKFLTSPATNPYTAIIYSAADATISDLKIIPSVKKSASKTVEMVVKKFYKSSSDYNLNADKEKEKAKVIEGIEIEEVKRNIKIKEIALGMKNQRTLSKDAKDFVDSQPSQDKEKVIKKILNYANKPKATHSKLDIVYARNNKIKAALFMIEYGDLDKEQLREALKEMNSYGMPISDSFIYEYKQLQKNK